MKKHRRIIPHHGFFIKAVSLTVALLFLITQLTWAMPCSYALLRPLASLEKGNPQLQIPSSKGRLTKDERRQEIYELVINTSKELTRQDIHDLLIAKHKERGTFSLSTIFSDLNDLVKNGQIDKRLDKKEGDIRWKNYYFAKVAAPAETAPAQDVIIELPLINVISPPVVETEESPMPAVSAPAVSQPRVAKARPRQTTRFSRQFINSALIAAMLLFNLPGPVNNAVITTIYQPTAEAVIRPVELAGQGVEKPIVVQTTAAKEEEKKKEAVTVPKEAGKAAAQAPIVALNEAGTLKYVIGEDGLCSVFFIEANKPGRLVEIKIGVKIDQAGNITDAGRLCEKVGTTTYKGETYFYREFVSNEHIKSQTLKEAVKGKIAVVLASDHIKPVMFVKAGSVIINPDGTITEPKEVTEIKKDTAIVQDLKARIPALLNKAIDQKSKPSEVKEALETTVALVNSNSKYFVSREMKDFIARELTRVAIDAGYEGYATWAVRMINKHDPSLLRSIVLLSRHERTRGEAGRLLKASGISFLEPDMKKIFGTDSAEKFKNPPAKVLAINVESFVNTMVNQYDQRTAAKRELDRSFKAEINSLLIVYHQAREEDVKLETWQKAASLTQAYLKKVLEFEREQNIFLNGQISGFRSGMRDRGRMQETLFFLNTAAERARINNEILQQEIALNDKLIQKGILFLPEGGRTLGAAQASFIMSPNYAGVSQDKAREIVRQEFGDLIISLLKQKQALLAFDIEQLGFERQNLGFQRMGVDIEHARPEWLKRSGRLGQAFKLIEGHPLARSYTADIAVLRTRDNALQKLIASWEAFVNNSQDAWQAQQALNEAVLFEQGVKTSAVSASTKEGQRSLLAETVMRDSSFLGLPLAPSVTERDEALLAQQGSQQRLDVQLAYENIDKAIATLAEWDAKIVQARIYYSQMQALVNQRITYANEVNARIARAQLGSEIEKQAFATRQLGSLIERAQSPMGLQPGSAQNYELWKLEGERYRAGAAAQQHIARLNSEARQAQEGIRHAQGLAADAANGVDYYIGRKNNVIGIAIPMAISHHAATSARYVASSQKRNETPYFDFEVLLPGQEGLKAPPQQKEADARLAELSESTNKLSAIDATMPARHWSHIPIELALSLQQAAVGEAVVEKGNKKLQLMIAPQFRTVRDSVGQDIPVPASAEFVQNEEAGRWSLKTVTKPAVGRLDGKKHILYLAEGIPGVPSATDGIVQVLWQEGRRLIRPEGTLLGTDPANADNALVAHFLSRYEPNETDEWPEVLDGVAVISVPFKDVYKPITADELRSNNLKFTQVIDINPDDTREVAEESGEKIYTTTKEIFFYVIPGNPRTRTPAVLEKIEKSIQDKTGVEAEPQNQDVQKDAKAQKVSNSEI